MNLMQRLDKYETGLVQRFYSHPFAGDDYMMPDRWLQHWLIQKWFLSQHFVPWYDRAVNSVRDPEAKKVLRVIVDEETPIGKPSHREDLLADLEFLGIPKKVVLTARPTRGTLKALQRLDRLVDYSDDQHYDLHAVEALRMAGEVLVAAEYYRLTTQLQHRFGLSEENSRFYFPHYNHDRKGISREGKPTHSDVFLPVLERMITDEGTLKIACDSAKAGYKARVSFFDQFTVRYYLDCFFSGLLGDFLCIDSPETYLTRRRRLWDDIITDRLNKEVNVSKK